AFSYRRQMQEGVNGSLLQFVESMDATAPDTLRITLSVADADFLIGLADGHSKVVAPEAVALAGDLRDGPTIGSGPWILTATSETGHAFERNADYFEEGLPFLDRLNIEIIPDGPTRVAALRARIVDMTQVEPFEARELARNNPGVTLGAFKDAGAGVEVALKATAPPFDDIRVRRAAFRAMNPWGAIEQIWQGGAYVALGAPTVNADWLLGMEELEGFLNQPEAARALLLETGAALPVPVTITVGDFGGEPTAHASRIAEEMRQAGFSPAIEVVNRRVFGEEVWIGGSYQMFVGPIAPLTSPNGYLLTILHSRGRWNTTGFRDAELDALIETQAQEFDAGRRGALIREIQRRAFEGAHRFMPAASAPIWAWWPRVQGFHPNFAGSEYAHWSRVWVR
ncbi:MAG: ABC transporter substrate-binding protein, partial [Chloroflexi bacterium]|nr:ABC transporter substrate-binding protein [Chloroflexota bacterium]